MLIWDNRSTVHKACPFDEENTRRRMHRTTVLGEIPFVEAMPELWILEDGDLLAARRIISEVLSASGGDEPEWTCAECGSAVDGVFARCWKCNADRPVD